MKRKLLLFMVCIAVCTLFISARGVFRSQEIVPSPSGEASVSYINISLEEADQYDYAHVEYHGTTTDCGSTDGWVDLGNIYFNNSGAISIDLYAPYGYIEAEVTVYIDGYPDCPYTILAHTGSSCSTTLRNLNFDFNPYYPWECPGNM